MELYNSNNQNETSKQDQNNQYQRETIQGSEYIQDPPLHSGPSSFNTGTEVPPAQNQTYYTQQGSTENSEVRPAAIPNSPAYNNPPPPVQQEENNGSKQQRNTEQFLLFSLIVIISITAIVIGVGWALFYPKTPTETRSDSTQETETAPLVNTPLESQDGNQDIVIIYGNDSAVDSSSIEAQETIPVVEEPKPEAKPETKPVLTKETEVPVKSAENTEKAQIPKAYPNIKYWIQVFSTNNRDRASTIQNELDTQGIKAVIVTKNINNDIYYRLRIGPYYNKDEGNKFLEWIRRNKKYQDAYISVEKS